MKLRCKAYLCFCTLSNPFSKEAFWGLIKLFRIVEELLHVLQCSSFAKLLLFRPCFAGEVFQSLGLLVYVLERIYISLLCHDAHPDKILRRRGVPTLPQDNSVLMGLF